jgi:putative transposase
VIESLTGQGIDVQRACVMLGVSSSGYYAWKGRPPSTRALRHLWLAGEITDVHKASAGTYGALRVTAELRYGRGITVGHNQVELIMRRLGVRGLPTRRLPRGARLAKSNALDLVRRDFTAVVPDRLWMTDITEHPTREGKIYCCAVLDAFSRMVVGWAIDSSQTALLVSNALGMAICRRTPQAEAIIHSDQGAQFASWAFSQKIRDAGLAPSMGAVGAPYDNAMIESFWARMQVELLNRKRWRTRVELATAVHDYIEIWHNTRRRHSALNMLTPTEYENRHHQQKEEEQTTTIAA